MYVKVFSQIYDGTLCTTGPWEALVTFQQMLILADQDGVVDMTLVAMHRRTTIPLEILRRGVTALMEPDPESRSPSEDGRRIVPVSEGRDWGWRVVNYIQYSKIRHEEERRAYHRNYWHTRKTKSADTQQTQQTQQNSTNSTNTDTDTDTDTDTSKAKATVHLQDAQLVKVARAARKKPAQTAARFAEFWQAYPNRKGKAPAEKKWRQLGLDSMADQLIDHVRKMSATDDGWKRGFAPMGSTYLNQKRWTDEPAKQAQAGPQGRPEPARPTGGQQGPAATKVEAAESFARSMVDLGQWTREEAQKYVIDARASERGATHGDMRHPGQGKACSPTEHYISGTVQ